MFDMREKRMDTEYRANYLVGWKTRQKKKQKKEGWMRFEFIFISLNLEKMSVVVRNLYKYNFTPFKPLF